MNYHLRVQSAESMVSPEAHAGARVASNASTASKQQTTKQTNQHIEWLFNQIKFDTKYHSSVELKRI